MDEQFDNELKNKISKMFENFEHPSVDKGWQKLQDKFPETGKSRGTKWFWAGIAAIAVLLVFWGLDSLIRHQEGETISLSQKSVNHYSHQNNNSPRHQVIDTSGFPNDTAVVAKDAIADTASIKPQSSLTAKNRSLKNEIPTFKNQKALAIKLRYNKSHPPKNQIIGSGNNAVLSAPDKKDDIAITQPANTAENVTQVSNTDTSKTISDKDRTTASVANAMTITEAKSLLVDKNPSKNTGKDVLTGKSLLKKPLEIFEKDRKRVVLGFYAASFFTYAQGSSINLNAGAGIAADIRLFRKLRLSTGVEIAQNTLSYSNQLPNFVVNAGATLAFGHLPNATNTNTYSLVLTNHMANLVGLSVPLNLKYDFSSQKNERYFVVGLSSGAFIHQSYTYQYIYSSQPVQIVEASNSLDGFYFAKTLNVAFGLGYPVGKANRLIVEPFLKYPLSGLGGEDIRFGSGGINLKFDFEGSKKQ